MDICMVQGTWLKFWRTSRLMQMQAYSSTPALIQVQIPSPSTPLPAVLPPAPTVVTNSQPVNPSSFIRTQTSLLSSFLHIAGLVPPFLPSTPTLCNCKVFPILPTNQLIYTKATATVYLCTISSC